MGLFGGNYERAGAGVSKNEREKKRFFLFLELLGRKFSKLLFLNFIYFAALLPLAFGIVLSVKFNPQIISDGNLIVENLSKYPLFVLNGDIIGLCLLIISVFITSPATCGFTYVIRNMQRQEHTWVFSDFREHFAKNYRQALALGIIDAVVVMLLLFAYVFYSFMLPAIMPDNTIISSVGTALVIIISLLFLMMHYYIYVMMVTFKLKIKDIFKNALIFTFAKLPLNLFLTVILALIVGLSFYYINVGVIFAFVFSLSFTGFLIVFSIYPTIDKYMIASQKKPEDDEFERDFED